MLYVNLFCAPVSKMCPKVSEKLKSARKDVNAYHKTGCKQVYLVWSGRLFFGTGNIQNFFHIN